MKEFLKNALFRIWRMDWKAKDLYSTVSYQRSENSNWSPTRHGRKVITNTPVGEWFVGRPVVVFYIFDILYRIALILTYIVACPFVLVRLMLVKKGKFTDE